MQLQEIGREVVRQAAREGGREIQVLHYDASPIRKEPGPLFLVAAAAPLVGPSVSVHAYDPDRMVARAKAIGRLDDLLAGRKMLDG